MSQARGQATGPGMGRRARRNVWRVRRYGSAGVATAMTAATSGSAAAATRAPAAPMEWPRIATRETSWRADSAATPARASSAYSPTDIGFVSGPFAPWPRTSNVRTWNPAALSTCAWGIVRSRADSQPWTRTTRSAARSGGDEPRRQPEAVRTPHLERLVWEADHVRRPDGGMPARVSGPDAVDEREPVCQRDGHGGDCGGDTGEASGPEGSHGRNRTATGGRCQMAGWGSLPVGSGSGRAGGAGYTRGVPTKDPHAVLGVEPGASPDAIKAAWRSLARRHHPDLTGDDPEAVQRATRRMAEINTAYAALTRAGETQEGRAGRRGRDGTPGSGLRATRGGARAAAAPAGRPRPPPPDR